MATDPKIQYRYVTRAEDICGGSPIITNGPTDPVVTHPSQKGAKIVGLHSITIWLY